jgi:hypothetical protein
MITFVVCCPPQVSLTVTFSVHVTDLHNACSKVFQLKTWLKSEQQTIDIVLISGDVANIPEDQFHTASKEMQQEQHDNLQRIVTDFRAVAERVYFIPGNVSLILYTGVGRWGGEQCMIWYAPQGMLRLSCLASNALLV